MKGIALGLVLTLQGCVASPEDDISFNETYVQDGDYRETHKKYTQEYEVIRDFETRYVVSVTFLSGEFRQAFAKRYQSLFNEKENILESPTDKTGFFVTLYSHSTDLAYLEDERLWNIQLVGPDGVKTPTMTKLLVPKERWSPFFPKISLWSKEYLVLFDGPTASSVGMVSKSQTKLIFSNPDAKLTFNL
jgi:hypothetical protein